MASENLQRTPEQFVELIRRQQRGRLKIYLGFAAGVGKTYEMLLEGQRLKRHGIDVAIGIVEDARSPETAAQSATWRFYHEGRYIITASCSKISILMPC